MHATTLPVGTTTKLLCFSSKEVRSVRGRKLCVWGNCASVGAGARATTTCYSYEL
jgi:hypothetical protein